MNAIYQTLNPSNTIIVNRPLTHAIGLSEAIVYAALISKYYYYAERSKLDEDGWFFSTVPDLEESTALSDKQQKRCVDKLVKLGLIKCAMKGMPAKRSFLIIEDLTILQQLIGEGEAIMESIKPSAAAGYERKRKAAENDTEIAENPSETALQPCSAQMEDKSNIIKTNINKSNINQSITQAEQQGEAAPEVPDMMRYDWYIKDEYFSKANDPYLMKNKEDGNARPTYYGFIDKNTNLLWMIPMSKRYEKYQDIVNEKQRKYGKCLGIIIGNYGGSKSAFLLQNMFPITEKYIDHVHELKGQTVVLSEALQKEIAKCSMKLRALHKKGKKVIFPDINRLEQMMFGELQQEQQHTVSQNLHDATPADKIAQLQQENSSLQRENAALRSENAEIKAISDRRAKAINTANAVLEANPELKKNFVAEKQKLTQMTEHKQHNNKPQSPPKSHKH